MRRPPVCPTAQRDATPRVSWRARYTSSILDNLVFSRHLSNYVRFAIGSDNFNRNVASFAEPATECVSGHVVSFRTPFLQRLRTRKRLVEPVRLGPNRPRRNWRGASVYNPKKPGASNW